MKDFAPFTSDPLPPRRLASPMYLFSYNFHFFSPTTQKINAITEHVGFHDGGSDDTNKLH